MTNKTSKEEKRDIKNLLVFCLCLDWGLSFMMWGTLYTAHDKAKIGFITAIVAICIVKPVWGVLRCFLRKETLGKKSALYFGVSTITYSLMFFWMFYETLYRIALINNLLYLILGIVGYVVCVGIVLYYRYNVYKGVYKDKSGVPKYSAIGIISVVGAILVRGYFEKLGEGMKPIIISVFMLIVSYVFSFGFTQLFNYWVASKCKKSI